MGYHSSVEYGIVYNAFRALIAQIDTILFGLLEWLYKLFFNVATSTSDLFSNEMVMNFFTRIQLIIGVFMMFQLAMSIIKGIMNPDTFTDSKTGFGNLIVRIMTALVMLTLLVPINIPSPRNEYEKQINNNGILFGTLYSLQNRILMNNTIGRLVLGTSGEDYTGGTDDEYDQKLTRSAKLFVIPIIKTVLKPNFNDNNLKPEELTEENLVCQNDISYDAYKMWSDPHQMSTQSVYIKEWGKKAALIDYWDIDLYFKFSVIPQLTKCGGTNGNEYGFNYTIIISTALAVLCIFFFLSFIIEVAKRSIKLGILRLIAPIPIISYMDSKSGKDGAFAAWLKLLIKTYLDLFLRLIIIHFIIFIIMSLVNSGFYSRITDQGFIGYMTFIAIIIGLLAFAKEAPKFMKDALGLKGDGFSLFGGLGAALGVGAAAAGIGSGALSGAASKFKNTDGNLAKRLGAGLLGGVGGAVGGGVNSGKALFKGDKMAKASDVRKANRAYAAQNYAHAADGSTLGGRLLAGAQSNVGLQNKYDRMSGKIKDYENGSSAWDRLNSVLDTDKNATNANYRYTDANGDVKTINSVKDLSDHLARVKAAGGPNSAAEQEKLEGLIKAAKQERLQAVASADYDSLTKVEDRQMKQEMEIMRNTASDYKKDKDGVFSEFSSISNVKDTDLFGDMDKFNKTKKAFGGAKSEATLEKNSTAFKQAESNAKRTEEKNKK